MVGKSSFLIALVVTSLIFIIGIMIGFYIENQRADRVNSALIDSEAEILDEQLRIKILSESTEINCPETELALFEFADQLYWDALQLEEYQDKAQFIQAFNSIHKRYDILRTMLWIEATQIKDRCTSDFNTVVYLYKNQENQVGERAEKVYYSNLLVDFKDKHPEKVLLIPIAVDNEVDALNMYLKPFNLTDYPSILVNEEELFSGLVTLEELENSIL